MSCFARRSLCSGNTNRKIGTRRIAPIFARARGFEHSTDLKRKGGLQAVLLARRGLSRYTSFLVYSKLLRVVDF